MRGSRNPKWLALAGFALSSLVVAAPAGAQFQSCVFCDVQPLNPDPYRVAACDTGTLRLRGIGYQTPNVNGCSTVPVTVVRSTRPDRVIITAFRIISDTEIEFDYQVPCNASPGITGIDVTIDDDSGDQIVAYACGNARMEVRPFCGNGVLEAGEECDDRNQVNGDGCSNNCRFELAVTYASYQAVRTRDGVLVTWVTSEERDSVAFAVQSRDRDGLVGERGMVDALGSGSRYSYLDRSSAARSGRIRAYQVMEYSSWGAGNVTGWFGVSLAPRGGVTVRSGGGVSSGGASDR